MTKRHRRLFVSATIFSIISVVAVFIWELRNDRLFITEFARIQSQSYYRKDMQYRNWISRHGGVYVKISKTRKDSAESDINGLKPSSDSSKDRFVLVSPAQIFKYTQAYRTDSSRAISRLTNFDPLNPENKPDEWEAKAMTILKKGKDEVFSVEKLGNKEFFRYIKLVDTDQSCINCHDQNKDETPQSLGALSIIIPWSRYDTIHTKLIRSHSIFYSCTLLFLLCSIAFVFYKVNQYQQKKANAEKLVTSKEELYRHLAEDMPLFVLSFATDGKITFVNQLFADYIGQDKEILLGSDIIDFLDKVDIGLDSNVLADLSTSASLHTNQTESVNQNGEKSYYLWTTRAIKNISAKTEYYQTLGMDITANKLNEILIAESEERYRSIVNILPDGVIIHTNGIIDYVNGTVYQLFGISDENEVIGKHVHNFVADKDKAQAIERLKELSIHTFKTTPAEFELIDNKGLSKIVLVTSIPFEFIGKRSILTVITDLTEKKRIEEKIRQSEERYQDIVTKLPVNMIIHTNGIIVFANDYAKMLFKETGNQSLVGTRLFDVIHPDYQKFVEARFNFIAETGKVAGKFEELIIDFEGNYINILATSLPVEFMNQKSVLSVFIDITQQKRNEAIIRDNEERYRNIVKEIPVGMVIHSDGIIVYANDAANEMMKADDNKKLLGLHTLQLAHPDYHSIVEERLQSIKNTKQPAEMIEEIFIDFEGNQLNVLVKSIPFLYYGRDSAITVFSDVTKQKLSEELVRENDAIFEAFLQHSPVYIFFKDEEINAIRLSRNFEHLLGKPMEQMIGKSMLDLFPSEMAKDMVEIDKKILQKNELVKVFEDFNDRFFESTKFPIKLSEDKKILAGFTIDITDRKKAEDLLAISEKRYRKLFTEMITGLVLFEVVRNEAHEIVDFKFISANSSFENITGSRFDQLRGDFLSNHSFFEEAQVVSVFKSIINENKPKEFEYYINRLKRHFEIKAFVTEKDRIAVQIYDITERKNSDKQILLAKEKAEESDRLKTAIIQNMSHEIRTPLNGILGFSKLLKQEKVSQEDRQEFSDQILKSGERLLFLLENILNLSNIESSALEIHYSEFDLIQLMNEFIDNYEMTAYLQGLELKLIFDPSINQLNVYTDRNKLSDILNNLVGNALKFTATGFVHIGFNQRPDELEIFVKDSGCGIAAEHQEKIFDRFYQIQSSISRGYEGVGLGLSIVKELTKVLKGTVRVESEPEIGTTFYIRLPLRAVSEEQSAEKVVVKLKTPSSKEPFLLIAEDDHRSLLLLNRFMSRNNIPCISVKNGHEAVETFKERSDEIDLVLLDVRMPVMDGIEATKKIKEINPNVPIIAQSAFTYEDEIVRCLSAGCADFMTKPLDLKLLLDKIRKYSGYKAKKA